MNDFITAKNNAGAIKNFWQKHGTKVVWIFLAVIIIICGYLIYIYYLTPAYDLNSLLPQNYAISFELKTDRFTLPPLQKNQIFSHPAITSLYSTGQKEINDLLKNWPEKNRQTLGNFNHLIFIVVKPGQYGFLGQIPNKKTAKELELLDWFGLNTAIIKQRIFLVTNDENLFKEMREHKPVAGLPPYLSIAINPYLNINMQSDFFNQTYPGQILSGLQKIFLPLSQTGHKYTLELKARYQLMELLLKPKLAELPAPSAPLNDLLKYLSQEAGFTVGFTDASLLALQLNENPYFKQLFGSADKSVYANYQVSLSRLLQQISGPIVFSAGQNYWRIVAQKDNLPLIQNHLRQYFGQFIPKTQKIRLPDGTTATELINNSIAVSFNEVEQDGLIYQLINGQTDQIGYFLTDNGQIVIGNQLLTKPRPFIMESRLDKFIAYFNLMPQNSPIKFSPLVESFKNITIAESVTGEIRAFLRLP